MSEPDDSLARWNERAQTPEGRQWIAAVQEAMRVWDIPAFEAVELIDGLDRSLADKQAMWFPRRDMPDWQRGLEDCMVLVADSLLMTPTVFSPVAVQRLRDALRAYDALYAKEQPNGDITS